MPPFGLIGPSYELALNADCQRTQNFYVTPIESGAGKSGAKAMLEPTPGLKLFTTLPGMSAVVQKFEFNGRDFAIGEDHSQQKLFELSSAGVPVELATLGVNGSVPYMAANQVNQMLICSGGRLFLMNLQTNAVSEINTDVGGASLQGRVSQIGFSDAYFIALLKDSNEFQISNLADGLNWNPSVVAKMERYPENIKAMLIDHCELWFWGSKQSVAYYDSGNPDFAFEPIGGAFIESAIIAPDSRVKIDNSLFWIAGDASGAGIAVRAQGYVPARISNFAVEKAWQSYPRIDDAIGYPFQHQGHAFVHWYFPTANKSWRVDLATGMFHEVSFTDGTAHRSRCHSFAFGKHLVGDWNSGKIYEMNSEKRHGGVWEFCDDDGQPIRRVRRTPIIANGGEYVFLPDLEVDLEVGLAPQPPLLDGNHNPRGPQMMMRISRDSTKTWSPEYMRTCGLSGDYTRRLVWRRLGRSLKGCVIEISFSDPVPCRITEAYLQ